MVGYTCGMNENGVKKGLSAFLWWGVVVIVVLMPFHALLTTWAGSNFGNLLWWRAWKEVFLFVLILGASTLFIIDKKLRSVIWARTINKAILGYAVVLLTASSLFRPLDSDAFAQGIAINIRFLVFFVLVQMVLQYRTLSRKLLFLLISVPAVGVVFFGVLQMLVLPKNFLQWFGYDKQLTIPPFFTVDEQLSELRYASTVSGPNTLGAYLLLPFAVVAGSVSLTKSRWQKVAGKWQMILMKLTILLGIAAFGVVLYGTQSRSAWIALLVSVAAFGVLKIRGKARMLLIAIALGAALVGSVVVYQFKETAFVQNVILHDNSETGGEVSSNNARLEAYRDAVSDIKQNPLLGCGVGCAGPASIRHQEGVKIAENYYLQIAQEAGLIALALFLVIIFLVAKELYKKPEDTLALALLSLLIGLSVANVLLHTWADETLAYLWWFTAAVVLYGRGEIKKVSSSDSV